MAKGRFFGVFWDGVEQLLATSLFFEDFPLDVELECQISPDSSITSQSLVHEAN
jgi:hypothetical protein